MGRLWADYPLVENRVNCSRCRTRQRGKYSIHRVYNRGESLIIQNTRGRWMTETATMR